MLRRELSHRPLLGAAFALAIGLAFRHLPWSVLAAIPLLVVAPSLQARVGVIALVAFGMMRAPAPVQSVKDLEFVLGECRVATVPRLVPTGESAILQCEGRRFVASWPLGRGYTYGQHIVMTAVAHPLREGSDGFWLRKGVVGRLDLHQSVALGGGWGPLRWGQQWRDSFRSFTSNTLPESSRKLVDALCFNVEFALDDDLAEDLRRTGTVHIISASGLHVGIFAVFLQGVLSRVPIARSWQIAILLAVLIVYMGAAGMRPPVVRSVVMAAVLLNAYRVRREGDLLSALGLATGLQLMADPWSVFDVGLHLSFMAVLGLGLFVRFDAPSARGFLDFVKARSLQVAHASLVAGLATAPIVAYHFGIVSVISILANLLITPLVAVIVPLALAGWAVAWLPPLAVSLMVPVFLCARALEFIVDRLGSLWFAAVAIPAFHPLWVPVLYLGMAGLWRERVRPA